MKKSIFAVIAAACLLGLLLCGFPSAEGYKNGETVLVDEPDTVVDSLTAFREDTPLTPAELTWVETGVHGKALALNGQSDYLEYRSDFLSTGSFAAAAWVNWQGSFSEDANGEINQRLFTVYRDEENYFSVCLRAFRDNIRETENGTVYRLDGLYMEYSLSGATGRHIEDFTPVTGDMDYSVPQRVWTHLAFTMDGNGIGLYVNGQKWFERTMNDAAGTLGAQYVRIGGSLNGGPTLYAWLDDVAWFSEAPDEESIQALAQGAALDFTGATEATVFTPTAPSESEEAETEGLHIPAYAYGVVGVVLILFIVAIVAVNRRPGEEDDS